MASNDNSTSTETTPPRRRRRGLKLFATVIGVLILLVGGLWLLAEVSEETDVSEDTFSAEGIDRLTVQVESGRIEVRVEERSDVAITTERISSLWSEPDSSVDLGDGTLSATGGCESTFFMANCAVNYTIVVPQSMIAELNTITTAGQIEIRGSSAEVNARTTAGEIRLVDYSGLSLLL